MAGLIIKTNRLAGTQPHLVESTHAEKTDLNLNHGNLTELNDRMSWSRN